MRENQRWKDEEVRNRVRKKNLTPSIQVFIECEIRKEIKNLLDLKNLAILIFKRFCRC
jgi:hypothetical protein